MPTIDYRAAADIDTSAAERTITLPDAVALNGRTVGPYTLKTHGSDESGYDAVFAAAGTDKINGTLSSIRLTKQWSVISFKSAGAGGWRALMGAGAVSSGSSSGVPNPASGGYSWASPPYRWIDHQVEVTAIRTIPSPLGVYRGEHIWAEIPAQSIAAPMVAGESVVGDGSVPVGEWRTTDLGKCPYSPAYPSNKAVFRIASDLLPFKNATDPITIGVYFAAISDQGIEQPVTRNGESGATPYLTLPIYPEAITPSGSEHGGAATTFDVTKGDDDNTTGTLRTPFTATASFENADPRVQGWSIWFRGDGDRWIQETAMMPLSVTSVPFSFDTPSSLTNIYFALVLHGADVDGIVKPNSIDENLTPIKKLTYGTTTGTLDPDAWKRDRIGSSIAVDDATGLWESIPYVSRLRAGTAIFDGDTVFAKGASGPRVGINSTGVDIYTSGSTATPYVSASSGGVTVSDGGSAYVDVTSLRVKVKGPGLGYVDITAAQVLVSSGGTPKVAITSSDVTLTGAGAATLKLDGTSIVMDSNVGPKVSVTSSALTMDSGSTPKVSVTATSVSILGAASTSLTLDSTGLSIQGAGHPVTINNSGATFGRQVLVYPNDGMGASASLYAAGSGAQVEAYSGPGGHRAVLSGTNGRVEIDGYAGATAIGVTFKDASNTTWSMTIRGGIITAIAPGA